MILLQPGQLWIPANPEILPRRITELLDDSVHYEETSASRDAVSTGAIQTSRATFRRWLRMQDASLDRTGQEDVPVSPIAELAKRISTLRRTMGMTQQQLADALNISRAAVTFMETGRTSSARRHIPRLAEIFQVPADVFLTGMAEKEIPATLSPDENDLMLLYRSLPPERKVMAQKWMERQARSTRYGVSSVKEDDD
ncbi:helix-turn-helix domain-containing protein [Acetobacter sp. AN02]|uniref:helix-turn-helix domain-containing protein n=1 Tax=Acetobacter sp. AN02 TaxID=2894186 RepID=UPI0024345A57|nr:helix-turn-helix transcriptional regulator [Acetobacter sp. AN02]MDG6094940.1 helix-turn-helix domain-containing protein [Acetobacter sp. AN02]